MIFSLYEQLPQEGDVSFLSQNKEEKAPSLSSSCKRALYICVPFDWNGIFSQTEDCFVERTEILKKSGFDVDIQRNLETAEQVANYIKENYPDGVDYLYFRVHGDSKTLCLSEREGGEITADLLGRQKEVADLICKSVKENGVLIVESCSVGCGEGNILEVLASQTKKGVLSIGSQTAGFEIQFVPELPKYYRFIKEGFLQNDCTQIYYQASSGNLITIPIDLLDALIALGGGAEGQITPEILDLYYRFLGERGNPEEFAGIREALRLELFTKSSQKKGCGEARLKEYLQELLVHPGAFSSEWRERFETFFQHATKRGEGRFLQGIHIDPSLRSAQLQSDQEGIHGIGPQPGHPRVKAFVFLLGVAALDRYRDVFSLLDAAFPEEARNPSGPLAQCIYALSGLAFHPQFDQTVFESMIDCIETTKNSYKDALEKDYLDDWFSKLVAQENPCATANVAAMNECMLEALTRNSPMEEGSNSVQVSNGMNPFNFFEETGYEDVFSAYLELPYDPDTDQRMWDKLLLGAACHHAEKIDEAIEMDWGTIDWREFYDSNLEKIVREFLSERQFSPAVLERALEYAAYYGRNDLIVLLFEKLQKENKMTENGYINALFAAARNGWHESVSLILTQHVQIHWIENNVQYVLDCMEDIGQEIEDKSGLRKIQWELLKWLPE